MIKKSKLDNERFNNLIKENICILTEIVNGSCTFDFEKCGWKVNSGAQYTWKLHHGNTTYTSTGPDGDHTTASKNGSYFYTISKPKSKENDISDLRSVLINSRPKQCLTFWYHIYGTHINTLKVFQVENTTLNLLWSKSDSQGNKWHFKFLSLNDTGPYHIMFRATRGKGIKSEIAVDDISIHNSDCKNGIHPRADQEKNKKQSQRNDYIGTQDIALPCLPLTANDSSCIQNDGKNTNTAYAVRRNIAVSDNSTLSDHKYSIVDQTPETTLNETTKDGKGTTDSYMVLDPSATGFNRTKLPNTYEFAKPVMDAENNIGDQDQYALSEEGVYDHSGNNRHKESEVNIYNHAVDTIYDSGSHKRNDEGRDDTYDHFFGQKTEDDYDISTTT
ncbi:unnamed protein product [Mytilus edulis]|uniref:MAM domain-containing protein n=1 Tax=Mytilus edulis TaxID=6550 RepID=A0A8S3UJY3_MYTED|nr:unnamed protein product [Mytilus edulis]